VIWRERPCQREAGKEDRRRRRKNDGVAAEVA